MMTKNNYPVTVMLIPQRGIKYVWDPKTKSMRPEDGFPAALPGAMISGANINEFVAWNGQTYVLRPTRDSVLADENLKLIGSVRELCCAERDEAGYIIFDDLCKEELKAEQRLSSGNPTTKQNASTQGRHRRIDPRNALIAELKTLYPDAKARRICVLIDQRISLRGLEHGGLAGSAQAGEPTMIAAMTIYLAGADGAFERQHTYPHQSIGFFQTGPFLERPPGLLRLQGVTASRSVQTLEQTPQVMIVKAVPTGGV